MQKKNGLIDSDKVFVTVAMWIANIVVFATALTLPMLPDKVTIFYRPTEVETALQPYYSKFNNLWLILLSVIPTAIILITTFFKRRNKMQNNFVSVMMFCIMLSLLMSSVIIYGITEQFDANTSVNEFNFDALFCVVVLFALSMLSAVLPYAVRSRPNGNGENGEANFKWRVLNAMSRFWYVGSFGFLVFAIVCTFIPGAYTYIALSVAVIAYTVFMLIVGNVKRCREIESN